MRDLYTVDALLFHSIKRCVCSDLNRTQQQCPFSQSSTRCCSFNSRSSTRLSITHLRQIPLPLSMHLPSPSLVADIVYNVVFGVWIDRQHLFAACVVALHVALIIINAYLSFILLSCVLFEVLKANNISIGPTKCKNRVSNIIHLRLITREG